VSRFFRKCGSLSVPQPYGPQWPVTGRALPHFLLILKLLCLLTWQTCASVQLWIILNNSYELGNPRKFEKPWHEEPYVTLLKVLGRTLIDTIPFSVPFALFALCGAVIMHRIIYCE
jgi:hypothetical protein